MRAIRIPIFLLLLYRRLRVFVILETIYYQIPILLREILIKLLLFTLGLFESCLKILLLISDLVQGPRMGGGRRHVEDRLRERFKGTLLILLLWASSPLGCLILRDLHDLRFLYLLRITLCH